MFSIIMIVAGAMISIIFFRSYRKKKRKPDRNFGILMAVLTALLGLSTLASNV